MDDSPTAVERLTDELRKLVGRTVWTLRLLTLPTLREFADVDSSLSVAATASAIRHYLKDGIASMGESVHEFQGKSLPGHKLVWALRLLMGYEGQGQGAAKRRERVIHILQLDTPLQQFRRETSPERELLRLLAEYLVSQSAR